MRFLRLVLWPLASDEFWDYFHSHERIEFRLRTWSEVFCVLFMIKLKHLPKPAQKHQKLHLVGKSCTFDPNSTFVEPTALPCGEVSGCGFGHEEIPIAQGHRGV